MLKGYKIGIMHRQIISITAEQKKWAEAEARRLGISVTEVFRRLLDKARGES